MDIVVIGGAGLVGSHSTAHLTGRHRVRVLDTRPSEIPGVKSVVGDARSADDVAAAVAGADTVVHMAAVVPRGDVHEPETVRAAFDVNVGSVHLALTLAAAAGVSSFVHVSTMSVFADYFTRVVDTTEAPDSASGYGLTKRLGEQVCAALTPGFDLSACSLRLVFPTPDEDWPAWRPPDGRPPAEMAMRDGRGSAIPALAAADLAAAFEAAATYRGPYRPFTVTADVAGVSVLPDDTSEVLGWRPSRTL
ncbi:nucleoside-diphosphate-sugar epimerase [Haloactinopolyspora alba]|uniref:Nucleoside-diphosphate-sugar epimerase n=1 Tax=Haloactinopolyspora alba TaxID=648780 RepID=A0A2P8DXV9_9ACTN|nr:NAD(P)-dependent oxidoreductase [Haloactinopolyspora alba]PSL02054.1 nucleoside-diphosphate-sugar epimerase [Haloactinopolyspora alba]